LCAVLLRPSRGLVGGLSDVVDCDVFCDGLTWLGDGSGSACCLVDAVYGQVNAALKLPFPQSRAKFQMPSLHPTSSLPFRQTFSILFHLFQPAQMINSLWLPSPNWKKSEGIRSRTDWMPFRRLFESTRADLRVTVSADVVRLVFSTTEVSGMA